MEKFLQKDTAFWRQIIPHNLHPIYCNKDRLSADDFYKLTPDIAHAQRSENVTLQQASKIFGREANSLSQDRAEENTQATTQIGFQKKTEHIAHISHELRSPLHGIVCALEMLQHSRLTNAQKELVTAASQSADYLLEIVNSLLDFSRIEASQLKLTIDEIDILALLDQVMQTVCLKALKKNLSLRVLVTAEVPNTIAIDSLCLRQILVNLLSNSVKFTDRGQIMITVACQDNQLAISVIDTGRGISLPMQSKVFDPYTQENSHNMGTGLGLSISARLAKMMGGKITLKSILGEGSCFTLFLPLSKYGKQQHRLSGTVVAPVTLHTQLTLWGMSAVVGKNSELEKEELLYMPGQLWNIVKKRKAASNKELKNQDLRKIVLTRCTDEDSTQIVRQGGLSRGFEQHAASLRNGLRMQAQTRPARATPSGRFYVTPKNNKQNPSLSERTAFLPSMWCFKVLIVDDIDVNRSLMTEMLQQLGHHCLSAADGYRALELGKQHIFDLVLLDIHMPEIDGLQTARLWRAKEQGILDPDCLIFSMSADVSSKKKDTLAYQAGINRCFTKPISLKKLARAMHVVEDWQHTRGMTLKPNPIFDKPLLDIFDKDTREKVRNTLFSLHKDLANTYQIKDATLFKEKLHAIKGVVGQAGMHKAVDAVAHMEKALMNKEWPKPSAIKVLKNLVSLDQSD